MRAFLVLSLTTLLSACTLAEWNSINRKFNPTDGDSRLIDAKQRAIISVKRSVITVEGNQKEGLDGGPLTSLAVCAEPSPDALQATAAALSGTGSSEALEAVLKLSFMSAESVASIGLRSQTIQLLRDAYFRLCEAFLNDGIDSIAYDVLQRRFQNQIIALLAVEQLTGAVKADQVGLNTEATGSDSSQAMLLTQTLTIAREDQHELQQELIEKENELTNFNNEKEQLQAAKEKADAERDKDATTKKDPALKEKAAQAQTALDRNATKIQAAEQRRKTLEAEIAQKNQQIETLTQAVVEAASAPITPNTSGRTVFGGDGTTSNPIHTPEVVNAVRAITLNAINQEYEAQVCFEALRYRNNVSQFRNDVNRAFKSNDKTKPLFGGAFINHCKALFQTQIKLRKARVKLIKVYADAVKKLVNKVGAGEDKIPARDVAALIATLAHAVPTEPGSAFLPRDLIIEPGNEGSQQGYGR